MIDEIVSYNREFVAGKGYQAYMTDKYPDKRLAILSCMDTRLTELLPAALGLKNGDAKIIKNAGGVISHPFGSAVRSILIAIVELHVTEVMVIGHTDCGIQKLDPQKVIRHLTERGISEDVMDILKNSGIHLDSWLAGFDTVEASVAQTVSILRNHPLIPRDVLFRGFVMDSVTGLLTPVSEDDSDGN